MVGDCPDFGLYTRAKESLHPTYGYNFKTRLHKIMKSSAYNVYDVSYRLSMFWSVDLHVEPRFDPKLEKHVRRVYLDNG